MNLAEYPTARRFHDNHGKQSAPPAVLDADWLRQLCLDCVADDAGLVEIGRYDRLTHDVEALLGRPATSVRDFVARHADRFAP